MYATDFNALVNDYYKGKAEIDMILVDPTFTGAGYKPLSTMSDSVQGLFKYNPEKAKQLLKDAGYPSGFKAEILVPNAASFIDQMAIIKGMWSKAGVDINIVPKETAVLTSMVTQTFNWTDMFYGAAGGSVGSFGFSVYTYFGYYRGDNRLQFASRTDPNGKPDPIIEAAFETTQKNLYVNWPAAYKAIDDVRPYLIEQAFKIPFPQPFLTNFRWPWVKGTYNQGADAQFFKYYWIDQDLKKSMGY
jgi:peptide/nickel transport system substrate-binding protein